MLFCDKVEFLVSDEDHRASLNASYVADVASRLAAAAGLELIDYDTIMVTNAGDKGWRVDLTSVAWRRQASGPEPR